jgi:predicted nucleotidyltransferase component of viral defense system
MTGTEAAMPRLHEDSDRFAEALSFTEAETTFPARLLEKDYYCTVLLQYLSGRAPRLVFKGGTCLAKVHANFFRLSEDLDFVIPVAEESTRTERRKLISPMKEAFAVLTRASLCFQIREPWEGANNSTQYAGSVSYRSLATGQPETIKIEVALRESLLTPPILAEARTALLDPVSQQAILPPISLSCLSRSEAFAEKFRAALSRREVAARDFFDLDYAVRKLELRTDDAELIALVRRKLAVPGNEPVDASQTRLLELRQQIVPQLQPVLRPSDFAEFDVERAFQLVSTMADRLR